MSLKQITSLPTYNPNRVLDAIIDKLQLKNDAALSRALEIRQKLGADGDKLQVIFISIDPERDTPELLGEYMRAFDPSFLGLRTDPKATAQTAFNYKVFYRRVPSGSSYTMDHTAISYVLDTEGRMRLGLKHQLTGDECVQDIKTLMKSKYTL